MLNFIKESHNILGMLILFLLLIVLIGILISILVKKPFGKFQKILALVGLISVHTQVLIGVLLYLISPLGVGNFSGESMGHSISRFYLVEHPVGMILAVFLITFGYKKSKDIRYSDAKRHLQILIFYGIGFALISYFIPWFLWN